MALLILMPDRDVSDLADHLRALAPELDLRLWPNHGNPDDIIGAVTWNPPPDALASCPNLRWVSSYGAGIDHLRSEQDILSHLIVTRIIDDRLQRDMRDYVLMAILNHRRHWEHYRKSQTRQFWAPQSYADNPRVLILGLGQLGGYVGESLHQLGYRVCGWSQGQKDIPGIDSITGEQLLAQHLKTTDFLVCLLPLTDATRGILNARLFADLQADAYLIQVGRGEQLVESDLIDALDREQLAGACIDVFNQEPLPPDHPFWSHPKIQITPHISSISDAKAVARQVIDNYRRLESGRPLLNRVDPDRGY